MAIRRFFVGLAIASIFVMSIWPLGSVPQATAETLNFKGFNHVTKSERFPIADVEGHIVNVHEREGAIILENGELGWTKVTAIVDQIKGTGTVDSYATYTFLDGSTFTTHHKGRLEASPRGAPSAVKFTGDIINGTGRFQGIKGTITSSTKLLPPEKGDRGSKGLDETTLVYTLPSK